MNRIIYGIASVLAVLAVSFASYGHSSAWSFPSNSSKEGQLQLPIYSPQTDQANGWNLVFADEFSGQSLDLTKWRPNWLASNDNAITKPANTAEVNCYNPANVSVVDGELHLTASRNSDPKCVTRQNTTAAYASGMIESHTKFDFTYGYVEARIWMPSGKGVWPTFWTDGSGLNWPTTGEIDIEECYGTDTSCSYHYHYNRNGSQYGPGGNYTVEGSTTGWHIYAVNWQPGKIEWFYDGVKVWEYTQGVISVPHFVIANLAMNGTQLDTAVMRVDYIRVWQNTAAANTQVAPPTTLPTSTAIVSPTLTNVISTETPSSTNSPISPSVTPILPSITPLPADTAIPTSILMTDTPLNPTNTPSAAPTSIPSLTNSTAVTDVIQSSFSVEQTSQVIISLINVPLNGYASAEFTCTYDPKIMEASNFQPAAVFGANPLLAINGPQDGQFILAIAGSNGQKATSDGIAFTFDLRGLKNGISKIQCAARVSLGGSGLVSINNISDEVTVMEILPTSTYTPIPTPISGVIKGQVLATKTVTIQLYDVNDQLILTQPANSDGTFSLSVTGGSYTIVAFASGFLSAQGFINLANGDNITMSTVSLPAGDIDGNGVIDQLDALTIGINYNGSLPSVADLDNDNVINVLDLEMPAANYLKSGALVWH